MSIRPVKRVVASTPTMEGAGVKLHRGFGFGETSEFDPFLLFDDFRNERPDDYLAGFPWHPHRGIETITYVLAGTVDHGDSLGNRGSLGAGDVQWMTAGSGIMHQEMPKGDSQGRMHGFQLWSNLPKALKMTDPRYQDILAKDIPEVTDDDGTRARIVVGDFWGKKGPVEGVAADPRYLDISVPPNRTKRIPVEASRHAFAYVFAGAGTFRDSSKPLPVQTELVGISDEATPFDSQPVDADRLLAQDKPSMLGNRSLVLFDSGDEITVTAGEDGIRFLLVSGTSPRRAGRVVWTDRDEYEGGTSAGVRRAQERLVHQASIARLESDGLSRRCSDNGTAALFDATLQRRLKPSLSKRRCACNIHAMKISRRNFVHSGAAAGIGMGAVACSPPSPAASAGQAVVSAQTPATNVGLHPALSPLTPMAGGVKPITAQERAARVAKAQQLMAQNKISALLLEGGSSMFYFTGIRWGLSERPFVCVLPAKGEAAWVSPGFEEERARELVGKTAEVRVWQEDESPYRQIAGILRDRGAASGRVGVEERMRFFIFSGVRKEAPAADFVDGEVITAGCRMIKSATELALMQKANDITIEAFRAAFQTFKDGMTQDELRANIAAAHRLLGAPGSAGVSFGAFTAFPHGSIEPQKLKEGDVIQVDGGCAVDGYQSDITRTTVFGRASARQTEIWNLEKKAQAAAFAVIKPGVPCEAVDAAARKVITDAGFGPDYKVPGLPHRTGHGIGLDGHEWTNFVRGNKTPLAPGMCFSNEPMVAIYGEFGIRLEDCLYITETGAQYFSQPSPSIDKPFA